MTSDLPSVACQARADQHGQALGTSMRGYAYVLRLTLLTPDLVEAIGKGRQPNVIEADCILKTFLAV